MLLVPRGVVTVDDVDALEVVVDLAPAELDCDDAELADEPRVVVAPALVVGAVVVVVVVAWPYLSVGSAAARGAHATPAAHAALTPTSSSRLTTARLYCC